MQLSPLLVGRIGRRGERIADGHHRLDSVYARPLHFEETPQLAVDAEALLVKALGAGELELVLLLPGREQDRGEDSEGAEGADGAGDDDGELRGIQAPYLGTSLRTSPEVTGLTTRPHLSRIPARHDEGQAAMPDHSLADWTYDVSKQVGAFTLTGLIAFAVAKRSHVWTTVNQVEWKTVLGVVGAALAILTFLISVIAQLFGT